MFVSSDPSHLDPRLGLHCRSMLPVLNRFYAYTASGKAPLAVSCYPLCCVSRPVVQGSAFGTNDCLRYLLPPPPWCIPRSPPPPRPWFAQHHCRRCGFVFCVACSDAFLRLPNVSTGWRLHWRLHCTRLCGAHGPVSLVCLCCGTCACVYPLFQLQYGYTEPVRVCLDCAKGKTVTATSRPSPVDEAKKRAAAEAEEKAAMDRCVGC